ncbi:ABC transporter ATP-binding protein [Luteococcus sediminum]
MTLTLDPPRPRHAELATAALQLDQVTVRHPDGTNPDGSPRFHTALDRASLSVQPGTFLAVVGPSGSGKSTLLSASAGLITPDEGRVTIAGTRLDELGDDERAAVRRERAGIVFQQPNLMASLTSLENVLLPLHLAGVRRGQLREARGRATELLGRVGLEGLEGRRAHQLSGGQRQRVAIARALVGEPSLLLVDEPTSALDQQASERIVALLAEVTRELGPATVMVTHDAELTAQVDRIVHVRDGRLSEG